VARRAWCEAGHILNTMAREQFLAYVRTAKPDRIKLFDARQYQEFAGNRPEANGK
jgi:hypothetical protein